MGRLGKVICAILLYYLNVMSAYENRTDLIKNITMALSSYFNINCFIIFHKMNDTLKNFETFKALSSDATISVGAYAFDNTDWKSCTKQLNVIIGEELKGEFAGFTKRNAMIDETWLVFLNTPSSDFFRDSRPSFGSEVVAAEIFNPHEVFLREIYTVDDGFPLRIVEFGKWTLLNGLDVSRTSLYERRSDLEGKVMRIGSNENWPVCSFSNGEWDGYMPRLWREIESLINCTTVPVRSVDDATGLEFKNRTWNGLMGMLLKNEIDVIAAELTMTKDRMEVIDFTYAAASAKYQLFFKALGYRLEWKAIFKPLALSTWLALFGWTVIGSLCISLTYYWYNRNGFPESERINFTKVESFFFILQSLCQQGYPVVPTSLSSRIIFITAYALSTIMIPSYSASLISSLTYQAPIRPFDSMEEMVAVGKYKLLVKRNSAAFSQFSRATDPLYEKIYRKFIDEKHSGVQMDNTVKVLDDIVCTEVNYAFYGIDMIVNLKMQHQKPKCNILTLSRPLSPVFISFGLRKDSPFARLIDLKLQKLRNIGSVYRLKTGLRPLSSQGSGEMVFRQVEVDEIFQVFLLLLLGMILSVIILIIEFVVWRTGIWPVTSRKGKSTEGKRGSLIIRLDVYMD
ncbi:UNVERIFIED_CONTAM: hypothetical protein PYX00_007507 [Menopon gallinae]|uniref:Uncharacterized protein n=1 Tax=Menopon gallinae TaxID=328185 RepID=A0AAW2HJB7_9NEOP